MDLQRYMAFLWIRDVDDYEGPEKPDYRVQQDLAAKREEVISDKVN